MAARNYTEYDAIRAVLAKFRSAICTHGCRYSCVSSCWNSQFHSRRSQTPPVTSGIHHGPLTSTSSDNVRESERSMRRSSSNELPPISEVEIESHTTDLTDWPRERRRSIGSDERDQQKLRSNSVDSPTRRASDVVETRRIQVSQKTDNAGASVVQVNQYQILSEIGKGSYGSVKLALNHDDKSYYALKVISKMRLRQRNQHRKIAHKRGNVAGDVTSSTSSAMSTVDEFAELGREIAVLKKLSSHQHCVRLVEFLDDKEEDLVYMVFDLCAKGPVMKIAARRIADPLPVDRARKYFRHVILGIEYLHHQKIIHRDIKPDNLLLNDDDIVQIADFGVSHLFEGSEDWLSSSSGSPAFYAPEVCSSATRQFHGMAVDIWASGVTLYCFIFGHCPWEANSVLALYRQIINDDVILPDHLDPSLADLFRKLLEKDAEKRITIADIRKHKWVTDNDKWPLVSYEENCQLVEVTPEEVSAAVKRSSSIGRRFREIFTRKKGTTSQTTSRSVSPSSSPRLSRLSATSMTSAV